MLKNRRTKEILRETASYILVFFLSSLILLLPLFNNLNNFVLDRLQDRNSEARQEIVIIGIDDKSLQEAGPWPLDRSKYEILYKKLNQAKPSVVATDIEFFESKPEDASLSKTLNDLKYPLVFPSKISEGKIIKTIYTEKGISQGFINLYPDSDGKIRKAFVSKELEDECQGSFAFMTIHNYLKTKQDIDCRDIEELGNQQIHNPAIFNYTDSKNFKTYSFADVIQQDFNPSVFGNKIVLIGVTTTDLKNSIQDNLTDIFGNSSPGVYIHANIINSYLESNFQQEINLKYELLFFFITQALSLYIYRWLKKTYLEGLFYLSNLAANIFVGVLMYEIGYNWAFIQTTIIISVVYVLHIVFKYLIENRENRFIQKAFARYLNPALLNELIENPDALKLGGEKKDMTVLFSDIRGFTALSERLSPEELISLTNSYLDAMSEVILQNNGTIDKYIGDAIMAFWNAPLDNHSHREDAIKTALGMESRLKRFNRDHPEFENLKIGIGINTGDMIVGNIGSSERFDYTVIGDNVNLGSRIEGLTKKYGVGVLVTEDTCRDLKLEGIIFMLVDEIIVKGKTKPIKIYQPMVSKDSVLAFKAAYDQAFELYQKGDFRDALKVLGSIKDEPVALALINRIEILMKSPADSKDWTGVWVWDEK